MGAQRIGFCTHSGLSISTQFWGRGLTVGIRVRQELRGDLGPGVVDQPDQLDPHRLAYMGLLQLATHEADDEAAQLGIDPGHLLQQRRRSEEHTSELQSLMRISYAVFCLKKKKIKSMKIR